VGTAPAAVLPGKLRQCSCFSSLRHQRGLTCRSTRTRGVRPWCRRSCRVPKQKPMRGQRTPDQNAQAKAVPAGSESRPSTASMQLPRTIETHKTK
jgi:ribosomal protein S13